MTIHIFNILYGIMTSVISKFFW